jgi:hypothetical protein
MEPSSTRVCRSGRTQTCPVVCGQFSAQHHLCDLIWSEYGVTALTPLQTVVTNTAFARQCEQVQDRWDADPFSR